MAARPENAQKVRAGERERERDGEKKHTNKFELELTAPCTTAADAV